MNQQLPDKVLRELVRGASKIYQNMCYGSMVTGDYNSAEAISKTMVKYVEENYPDEYRPMKVEIEEYE